MLTMIDAASGLPGCVARVNPTSLKLCDTHVIMFYCIYFYVSVSTVVIEASGMLGA